MKKMNLKKINEIFYSLQGEGKNVGRAAVFIRFSGCNLNCPFCDTQHQGGKYMDDEEILEEISEYPTDFIVLTGGEPTLYIDDDFLDKLHEKGYTIAIETNGTRKVSNKVDFITLSPKFEFTKNADLQQTECDELKVIYNGANSLELYDNIKAKYKYLQPLDANDEGENEDNTAAAIHIVYTNPEWRLSVQLQKILKIK